MALRERILPIRLLVLDVDGVLTRGGIEYSAASACDREHKTFHVRDGSGLKRWHQAGGITAIITGRSSLTVATRADETGIAHVLQRCHDKAAALAELLARLGLTNEAACFVGDDIIDTGAMRLSGLAVAVADACPEARGVAHHVTSAIGGEGAVREVIELVMRCQGSW